MVWLPFDGHYGADGFGALAHDAQSQLSRMCVTGIDALTIIADVEDHLPLPVFFCFFLIGGQWRRASQADDDLAGIGVLDDIVQSLLGNPLEGDVHVRGEGGDGLDLIRALQPGPTADGLG